MKNITQLEKHYIEDYYLKYLINNEIFISSNIECIKPDKINLKLKDISIEQLIGKDNKNKFIKITKLINKTRHNKKDFYSKFDKIIENEMNGEDRFEKYGKVSYIDNFIFKQLFCKKYNINRKLHSGAFRKLYEILVTYPKFLNQILKNYKIQILLKLLIYADFLEVLHALLYYTKTQSKYEALIGFQV